MADHRVRGFSLGGAGAVIVQGATYITDEDIKKVNVLPGAAKPTVAVSWFVWPGTARLDAPPMVRDVTAAEEAATGLDGEDEHDVLKAQF